MRGINSVLQQIRDQPHPTPAQPEAAGLPDPLTQFGGGPTPLEEQASRLETWGVAIKVLALILGVLALVGGLLTLGTSPYYGGAGIGFSVSAMINGFWWSSWHDAAAAHLRGLDGTLRQMQRQSAVLARIEERLPRGGPAGAGEAVVDVQL